MCYVFTSPTPAGKGMGISSRQNTVKNSTKNVGCARLTLLCYIFEQVLAGVRSFNFALWFVVLFSQRENVFKFKIALLLGNFKLV